MTHISKGGDKAIFAELEKLISQAHSSRKAMSAHEVLANRQLSAACSSIYTKIFLALKITLLNLFSTVFIKTVLCGRLEQFYGLKLV